MKKLFKQQSKQKKSKVPKEKKKVNSKLIARLIWGVLIFWLVLTVVSFIRMSSIASKNRALENDIEALQEKTDSVNLLNQDSALDLFLKRYATNYFAINDNKDQMENRVELLSQMSASDMEYDERKLEKGSQSLVSISPYEFENREGYDVATYNITYRVEEDDNETDYSVAFNIPVKREKNNHFLVVAEPYITDFNADDLNGSGNRLSSSISLDKNDNRQTNNAVKEFVEQFLTSYQEGDLDQLRYLMNDPQGLNGQYEIKLKDVTVFGSNDEPFVELNLDVKQKDNDIRYSQQMRLSLITKDDKYFVEDMNQVID